VQGVYYRASTAEQARALGLSGWVRNLPDGRVELEAEGDATAVARLVDWLHAGPPAARVDDVAVSERDALGEAEPFRVRR
jgi:acylphosphatase